MITPKKLGKVFKYFRTKKGLSAEELGIQVSKSQSVITDIENGKRFPKLELLIEINKVLGIDTGFLIFFLNDEKDLDMNFLEKHEFSINTYIQFKSNNIKQINNLNTQASIEIKLLKEQIKSLERDKQNYFELLKLYAANHKLPKE